MASALLLVAMWWLLASAVVWASEPPEVRPAMWDGPLPRVDGVLDEPGWAAATPITEFSRFLPTSGPGPSSQTDVRILQDDENLYIGVRVSGCDYTPRAHITPRENINADDQIGIYLDTVGDARSGYIFYLSALGIQQDIRYADGNWFTAWNTVFYSRGRLTDDGYELEIVLPFRSVRYPRGVDGPQTWGLMVTRKIPEEGTKYAFPNLTARNPRIFSDAARLRGVRPPPAGAGVQAIPVVAVSGSAAREAPGDPMVWERPESWMDVVRPGADVRVGLTSDIGLAATVNPDFSQVEGDGLQIDLNRRFAFFNAERRPFFLDGAGAFADHANTLYSRSIVEPAYGVKVSGRSGPVRVGILQGIDRSPAPSIHQDGAVGFSEDALADQMAANAFGRVQVDAFGGGHVGLTLADKRTLANPSVQGAANTGAFNDVGGFDVWVPAGESGTFSAHAMGSVIGTDDEAARLGGWAGAQYGRSPELGTGFGGAVNGRSIDYRAEMGFLNESGVASASSWVDRRVAFGDGRSLYRPAASAWVRRLTVGDGNYGVSSGQHLTLDGTHNARVGGSYWHTDYQGASGEFWSVDARYGATFTSWLSSNVSGSYGTELDFETLVPAQASQVDASATIRPTLGTRLDLSGGPQWFLPDGGELVSAGRIYGRLTWQMTRSLGVRTIAQTVVGPDVADPIIAGSAMLTWLRTPGTEAYVGGSWSWMTDGGELQDQALFFKMSRLFQM